MKLIGIVVVFVAVGLFALRQYNAGCTCQDQVDLTGKFVLITGGNSGIGYETSKGLALRNATVIIGTRELQRGLDAAKQLKNETGNENIMVMALDLSSLRSVKEFVAQFKEKEIPIHILINNAGVWMGDDRKVTEDGFEMTFGVNHLGHFLLTNMLLDEIKKGKGRVVTVSSGMHLLGTIDFDNLQSEKNYSHFRAYANSKLANVLFSNELARRLEGSGVISLSLHPGVISTGLHKQQEKDYPSLWLIHHVVFGNIGKTMEEGAQTTISAAISPRFNGKTGLYLKECDSADPNPLANDEKLAQELWDLSVKLLQL